jgi:hypothetical protein
MPAHLLERHPGVDKQGRGGMTDAVRAEAARDSAFGVVAAGRHEREGEARAMWAASAETPVPSAQRSPRLSAALKGRQL